jgi:hypothetical protein
MNAPQNKKSRLKKSDESINSKISTTQIAGSSKVQCPLKKLKKHYHFGLQIAVQQYPVEGRRLSVNIPTATSAEDWRAEKFHELNSKPWQILNDEKRIKKTSMQTRGEQSSGMTYRCDLTTIESLLVETGVPYFQPGQSDSHYFNAYLGEGIAVHIFRDHTYRNDKTGNFRCGDLQTGQAQERITEKLAAFFRIYLQTKLNGKIGLINGAISRYNIKIDRERREIEHELEFDKIM